MTQKAVDVPAQHVPNRNLFTQRQMRNFFPEDRRKPMRMKRGDLRKKIGGLKVGGSLRNSLGIRKLTRSVRALDTGRESEMETQKRSDWCGKQST
jgi:hypothetical protein